MNIRDFRIAAGQQTNISTALVWTSGGSNNNWSTTANWNGNRRPTNGCVLNFGAGARLAPVNDLTALIINGITFTTAVSSFAISGNSFTQADGSSITNNSSNSQSIANPIALATGTAGLTFNTAAGNITASGIITGGNRLIKTGNGTLTLSAVNAYSNGTYINAGTVKMGNTAAVGPNGAIVYFSGGGTLDLNGLGQFNQIAYNSITVGAGVITNTSPSTTVQLVCGANNGTFSGNISQTGGIIGISKNSTFSQTFSGANNSTGSIVVNRGGLILNQIANSAVGNITFGFAHLAPVLTYTGLTDANLTGRAILIQGNAGGVASIDNSGTGTLSLGSAKTEASLSGFAGAKTLTLQGSNTGNNTIGAISNGLDILSVTKSGVGKWILAGNNTYTGSTSITAGTLIASKDTAIATFTPGTLTVNFSVLPTVGQTFRFFLGATTQTYAPITLIGAGTLQATYNSPTSTLTITA